MLRRFKGSKYNRLITTALLIILQLFWLGLAYIAIYNNFKILAYVVKILAAVYVLYIVQKDDSPAMKIGWIVLILSLPIIGVPLYLFYGDRKPTRKMYDRIKSAQLVSPGKIMQSGDVIGELTEENERASGTSRYIYSNSGFPVYGRTSVKYYHSGEMMFHDMYIAMKDAKKYIFLEYFIFENGKMWNTVLSLLLEKAKEGVEIKIIYDDFGIIAKRLPIHFDRYLEELHPNIRCLRFNPVLPLAIMSMNNRDHRKLLIVDGEKAFTGGINLADEYINEINLFGYWKDTGIRMTGEAVNSFVLTFIELWNAFRQDIMSAENYLAPEADYESHPSDGYVQPFSDCPLDDEYLARNVIIDMLSRAREHAYICTPYLIIDSELRAALCIAAKRGVDVRIVTPGIPDKKITFRLTRANFRPLLSAGVKLYAYTPGFIHAKSVVVDANCAMIGTVNLDYRSMYLHFEDGVYLYGSSCIEDMSRDFISVCRQSRQLTHADLKQGIFGSAIDSILRAFETLF